MYYPPRQNKSREPEYIFHSSKIIRKRKKGKTLENFSTTPLERPRAETRRSSSISTEGLISAPSTCACWSFFSPPVPAQAKHRSGTEGSSRGEYHQHRVLTQRCGRGRSPRPTRLANVLTKPHPQCDSLGRKRGNGRAAEKDQKLKTGWRRRSFPCRPQLYPQLIPTDRLGLLLLDPRSRPRQGRPRGK